ncbi:MAG: TspO/MBR family protein [Archaeoglobaceae archaeon]
MLSIGICLAAGFIGSIFTTPAIPVWYATLQKPFFTPPNWVFGPAWTTLYILMGIALFLVWNKGIQDRKVQVAMGVFGVQLVLNSLWSILFFGMQNPFYAFIEVIILWFAILATIILFYGIDKRASFLLVPYILWVSFASVLNYYVWILN